MGLFPICTYFNSGQNVVSILLSIHFGETGIKTLVSYRESGKKQITCIRPKSLFAQQSLVASVDQRQWMVL